MVQNFDTNKLMRGALDAIEHLDAAPAYQFLRLLDENMSQLGPEYQNSTQFKNDLALLKMRLRFVAFPELPPKEAQELLQKNLLEFLSGEIDLADRLAVRYTFVGYNLQNEDRQNLKSAILKNQEQIGEVTIGDWLKDFDRFANPEDRDSQATLSYITQSPKAAALDKSKQNILRKLLGIYDQWLATELLNIFDLAVLYRQTDSGSNLRRDVSPQDQRRIGVFSNAQSVQLPLLQALSKFENLGNQLVTAERIKIKSQVEPVRPSLFYWIKYYRDELGIGQHSSVERGQFLFRSENCKKLTPEERERVNLILKSIEENFPLSIDPARQEIVFPAFQGVLMGSSERLGVPSGAGGRPAFQDAPMVSEPTFQQERAESFIPPVKNNVSSKPSLAHFAPRIASPPSFPEAPRSTVQASPRTEQIATPAWKSAPVNAMPPRGGAFSQAETNAFDRAESGGELSFSAKHIFPAEKETIASPTYVQPPIQKPEPVQVSTQPSSLRQVPPQTNPFSIHPVSRGSEEDVM